MTLREESDSLRRLFAAAWFRLRYPFSWRRRRREAQESIDAIADLVGSMVMVAVITTMVRDAELPGKISELGESFSESLRIACEGSPDA